MVVIVFAGLSVAYMIMGGNQAFLPGSFEASKRWLAVMFTVDAAAAIIGGWACAKVARSLTPLYVLIGIVVVYGGIEAALAFQAAPPAEVRTSAPPLADAMTKAYQPGWAAAMHPVIGAIGAWVGAKAAGCKRKIA